ncbi:MAG: phospholipid carrier-dependent glycosyltransferase [Patescibacteria group bacterium]
MTTKHYLLLLLIVLFAGGLRFTGLNWDAKSHLHPDERFLTMVASSITLPSTIMTYFDTTASPANPHNRGFSFYVYGTYPLHGTKLVARLLHRDTYDEIVLIGRALSGVADLITVILVFCIGAHLTKRNEAGLLAALCYALAVVPIQLSHFFTVDPYVTLFITIALWHILRGRIGFFTGVAIGLAISAKISAILILPVLFLCLISLWPWRGNTPAIVKKRKLVLIGGFLSLVGLLLTVRVSYPYLFSGLHLNPLLLANWKQLASFDGPTTSFPPGLQWVNVSPLQPALDLIVFGLGLPLSTLACMSIIRLALAFWKKPRWNPMFFLVLWVFFIFGYQSLQFAKPMRYFWAAYPSLAVFAGITLYQLLRFISHKIRARYVGQLVNVFMCASLFLWPLSFVSMYSRPHTRVAASTWIFTHVPPQSTIAWEHWDDPLPFAIAPYTPSSYTQIQLPSFDPDDAEKIQKIQNVLTRADYLILSSNRAYGSLKRAGARFPLTNRLYQRLFSGALGFDLVAQFTSRPMVPVPGVSLCIRIPGFSYGSAATSLETCNTRGIHIVDDYADETFTVYDHPKVLIFRNTQHLSPSEITTRLHE